MPHARVAVFVGDFPQLSETFVIQQVAGLLEAGHEVGIFAERRAAGGLAHPDVGRFGLMARARFASDHWAYKLSGRLARPYRLSAELRRVAVRATDAQAAGFDAILCHFGTVGLRVCANPRLAHLRTRMATILHGADISAHVREWGLGVYAPLIAAGGLLLPVSRHFARRLIESLGARESTVRVMPMGVDCDALAYRERPPRAGPVEILMVGRMVEKKGAYYALRALARVSALRPELSWTFTLVGDGPLRAELDQLRRSLEMDGRITFAGPQPAATVRSMMRAADIFVLPSVTGANGDEEGVPVALMEAMATGAAVISTTHSGIPELVEDEVSGLLAPERDCEALALALIRLIESFDLRARLGAAARARVEQGFEHGGLTRSLSTTLNALVSQNVEHVTERSILGRNLR